MNIKPLWLLHLYLFYYVFTENLALHQPAGQSDTYMVSYTADLAVNGRRYTGLCAGSDRVQTAVWWVDLGGVKNIHHVLIYHNDGKSILNIIYFKITRYYPKWIDVILIITISGINEGWMWTVHLNACLALFVYVWNVLT